MLIKEKFLFALVASEKILLLTLLYTTAYKKKLLNIFKI